MRHLCASKSFSEREVGARILSSTGANWVHAPAWDVNAHLFLTHRSLARSLRFRDSLHTWDVSVCVECIGL